MLRYVLLSVAACCGVACIFVGLEWVNPTEQGNAETAMYSALGDGLGKLIGWALIMFGGLISGGSALAGLFLLRRVRHSKRTAVPSLPEARAHVAPPSKNGK